MATQLSIATKRPGMYWLGALALTGMLLAGTAEAGIVVGTVTDVNGPMVARHPDGTIKVLSLHSAVEQGDVLVTEKATFAHIKMIDNGEITLRPNTQFKIENFSYDAAKPEADSAFFTLIKGGLRSITGLLGKRNHEKFGLNTPTATIGIRGTTFVAEYIPPSQEQMAAYQHGLTAGLETQYGGSRTDAPQSVRPLQLAANPAGGEGEPGSVNPGLYVQVTEGAIQVANTGGSQVFSAGQFGFVATLNTPPVILPSGQLPLSMPTLNGNKLPPQNGAGSGTVDCIVR